MLKGPKYAMDKTIIVVNNILTRTSNKTCVINYEFSTKVSLGK